MLYKKGTVERPYMKYRKITFSERKKVDELKIFVF